MVITLVIMVLLQLQQMPLKYIEITNIFNLTPAGLALAGCCVDITEGTATLFEGD